MLTRIWLLYRRVMQRLNRLIWRKRLECLTRLTERQLKAIWQLENLGPMSEWLLTPEWESKTKKLMRLQASLLVAQQTNQELEQVMMDLQTASRQLTSMLTSKTYYEISNEMPQAR